MEETTTPTKEAPALPKLSDEVQKAVDDAFGDLVEKVRSQGDALVKAERERVAALQPKAWFVDPFSLLDSVGMGYRASPSYLTYETLRQVSERDTAVASVLLTRINQVAAFCRPQENKYSVGFKIRPRGPDKKRRLSDSEKDRVEEIQTFVLNTGKQYSLGRDSFEQFMRKLTRDSLTYDQAAFEKVPTYGRGLYAFHCVPGDTLRIAHPKTMRGTPATMQQAREQTKYVQLINTQIVAEFTQEEMAFMVRNPRTNVRVFGYGFSEIEQLISTITSHLWAEEWNRRAFSQGSTVKGILNLKGNMPANQFEMFKRQWTAQVAGITNAWKTPVTNVDEAQWIQMQMSNTEMGYQMWMEYLIKIICAIFQIDPAEINFDLRGSATAQPLFMSNNEAQQKVSKDRGLHPLLRFLEDHINKHIVWTIDPRFEFAFVGLDAKTEEQAAQLRMQQVQNVYTLNEVRAMEDLPPVPDGDVPLNPTYTGYVMQKKQMDAQAQMMGGGQGGAPGGGQPPGGPQQQAQPMDQSQPYQGRFQSQQPGEEEAQGANNLNAFFRRALDPMQAKKQDDESGDDHSSKQGGDSADDDSGVSDAELESLHINDWESDVHASLKDGNLNKSLYDTVDL